MIHGFYQSKSTGMCMSLVTVVNYPKTGQCYVVLETIDGRRVDVGWHFFLSQYEFIDKPFVREEL